MTGWVNLDRSAPISRHLSSMCAEASDSTYVRDVDLKMWAELPGKIYLIFMQNFMHINAKEKCLYLVYPCIFCC